MPLNEKANNIVFTNINMFQHIILSAIDIIKKLDEYIMYLNSFWLSEFHDTVLVSLSTGMPLGSLHSNCKQLSQHFSGTLVRNKEQSHETEVANKTKLKQLSIFSFFHSRHLW